MILIMLMFSPVTYIITIFSFKFKRQFYIFKNSRRVSSLTLGFAAFFEMCFCDIWIRKEKFKAGPDISWKFDIKQTCELSE